MKITDNEFDSKVLKSDKPVLVDFYANWCGPCVKMNPTVDEVSVEYSDKLVVYTMDIDKNPATPVKYNIRSIPNFLIFKGGVLVDSAVGGMSKDKFKDFVTKNL